MFLSEKYECLTGIKTEESFVKFKGSLPASFFLSVISGPHYIAPFVSSPCFACFPVVFVLQSPQLGFFHFLPSTLVASETFSSNQPTKLCSQEFNMNNEISLVLKILQSRLNQKEFQRDEEIFQIEFLRFPLIVFSSFPNTRFMSDSLSRYDSLVETKFFSYWIVRKKKQMKNLRFSFFSFYYFFIPLLKKILNCLQSDFFLFRGVCRNFFQTFLLMSFFYRFPRLSQIDKSLSDQQRR